MIGKCQKFYNPESMQKHDLVWPNNFFAFFLNMCLFLVGKCKSVSLFFPSYESLI